MSILVENASVTIDDVRILASVTARMPDRTVTGILGPNGAGKSTLLRLIAGIQAPVSGRVLVCGDDVHALRRRDAARRIAMLEQSAELTGDLTALEVVLLGRIPHRRGMFAAVDGPTDRAAAANALEAADASALSDRRWHSLSGGERQRVHIARALAQEPAVLLLDEPTNHLDVRAQLSMLARVRALGLTSVVALHDLNLAAAYCDRIVMLSGGRVVASGTPREVLTRQRINDVYGADCDVIAHPRHGGPLVVFAMDGAVPADQVPVSELMAEYL